MPQTILLYYGKVEYLESVKRGTIVDELNVLKEIAKLLQRWLSFHIQTINENSVSLHADIFAVVIFYFSYSGKNVVIVQCGLKCALPKWPTMWSIFLCVFLSSTYLFSLMKFFMCFDHFLFFSFLLLLSFESFSQILYPCPFSDCCLLHNRSENNLHLQDKRCFIPLPLFSLR